MSCKSSKFNISGKQGATPWQNTFLSNTINFVANISCTQLNTTQHLNVNIPHNGHFNHGNML